MSQRQTSSVAGRLRNIVGNHGWKAPFVILRGVERRVWKVVSSSRRKSQRAGRALDERYGIETTDDVSVSELGLPAGESVQYAPSSEAAFRDAMSLVAHLDTARYHFYDVGCGKGRILIFASSTPWASINGIELSPDLAEIARSNLARVGIAASVICSDAARAPVRRPAVLYMYNSFFGPAMRRFLDHLQAGRSAGPVLLLYYDGQEEALFRERGLEELGRAGLCSAWKIA